MLDLKYIRENAKAVKENARNRGVEADVDLVVELADRRSDLIQESNELKQRQNQMARSIGRERDEEARAKLIEESRAMKEQLPLSAGGLGGQGVEQFGRSEALVSPLNSQLSFPDHVHEFDTDESGLRCVKRFES